MNDSGNSISIFNFTGELVKTYTKKDKVQYIKLVTEEGEYWIKVAKRIRENLASLYIGCQLEVLGTWKQHPKTGEVKYKAQTVILIPAGEGEQCIKAPSKLVSASLDLKIETKSKARVLICTKSNCWKKGGKKVCDRFQSILSDRGLDQEITIKKTGCLKKCKQAPTLVMMPDKARYSQVKPKQVADLIDKHLIAER